MKFHEQMRAWYPALKEKTDEERLQFLVDQWGMICTRIHEEKLTQERINKSFVCPQCGQKGRGCDASFCCDDIPF